MPKRQLTPPSSYLRWRYAYDPVTGELHDRATGEPLRGSATRNTLQLRMGSRNFAAHRVIFKLITNREAPRGADVRREIPERRRSVSYDEWRNQLAFANRIDNLEIDSWMLEGFEPDDYPGIDRVTRDVTDYAIFHDASFEPSLRTTTPAARADLKGLNPADPQHPRKMPLQEIRDSAQSAYAAASRTKRLLDEHIEVLAGEIDAPMHGVSFEQMRRIVGDNSKYLRVNELWRMTVDLEHARHQVETARRNLAYATPTKGPLGSVAMADDRDTMGEGISILLAAEINYATLRRAYDVVMGTFTSHVLRSAQTEAMNPERADNLIAKDRPDVYIPAAPKSPHGRRRSPARSALMDEAPPLAAGLEITPRVTTPANAPSTPIVPSDGGIHPDLEDVMAKLPSFAPEPEPSQPEPEPEPSQPEDAFIAECEQRLHGYVVNAFVWDDPYGDPSRGEDEAEAREFRATVKSHTSRWFAEWVRSLRLDEDNNPVGTVADLRPDHMESIIRTIQHVSRDVLDHKRRVDPELAEGGSLLVATPPAGDSKTPSHTAPESFTDDPLSDDPLSDDEDIDPLADLSDLEDTRE